MELRFEILTYKLGIPSKCMSLTRTEYVPALCTHRPSLLPIEWAGEWIGATAILQKDYCDILKFTN